MTIIYPPPLSARPELPDLSVRDEWDYVPLPKRIPITEQIWPEGTRPLVSVYCITYNHENYIGQAIEGFLMQQTNFPVQIFIHDDASTDKTVSIIREYEAAYQELILAVFQPVNLYSRGILRDVNHLLLGKYIAFCEGDDYWIDINKLSDQLAIIDNDKKCVLVGARTYLLNASSSRPFKIEPSIGHSLPISSTDFFLGGDTWMHTATRVWRKSHLDEFNRDITNAAYSFDLGRVLYALAKASSDQVSIRMLDRVTSVYRCHPGGIHSSLSLSAQRQIAWRIRCHMIKYFQPGAMRMLQQDIVCNEFALMISDPGTSLKSLYSKLKNITMSLIDNPPLLLRAYMSLIRIAAKRLLNMLKTTMRCILRKTGIGS